MSARGFARLDGFGNLVAAQSKGVIGVKKALRGGNPVRDGAYCFNLDFAPASVTATPIAHPDDTPFPPVLHTAGPNLSGELTKDNNGSSIQCPAGFHDAALISRVASGDGLALPPGGCFLLFN